jgi:hypothetical protein
MRRRLDSRPWSSSLACIYTYHTKQRVRIGGFWGPDSYAGSFPNDGDSYLQAVYEIDEHGKFGEAKEATRGVPTRKDQYTCLELFAVPPQEDEESSDERKQKKGVLPTRPGPRPQGTNISAEADIGPRMEGMPGVSPKATQRRTDSHCRSCQRRPREALESPRLPPTRR